MLSPKSSSPSSSSSSAGRTLRGPSPSKSPSSSKGSSISRGGEVTASTPRLDPCGSEDLDRGEL